MSEPRVVVAGEDPFDDVLPGYRSEKITVWTVERNHLLIRVNVQRFPFMTPGDGNRKFHQFILLLDLYCAIMPNWVHQAAGWPTR
jgi:hypothetical protein